MNDSIELKAFKQLEEKRKRAVLLNANICPDCGEGHLDGVVVGGGFGHVQYYCTGEKVDGHGHYKKNGCGFSISSRDKSQQIKEGKELNNVE